MVWSRITDGRTWRPVLGYIVHLVVSEVETDLSQIRRDLEYYEEKIDPADGPAMSHSVLAVLYWRLGMRSKAFKALEQSYIPNLRRPFCTFSETPSNDSTYFLTGACGFLQALMEINK